MFQKKIFQKRNENNSESVFTKVSRLRKVRARTKPKTEIQNFKTNKFGTYLRNVLSPNLKPIQGCRRRERQRLRERVSESES